MKGQVNAHTHLYSALVPFGMPAPEREPGSFLEILERVWWRLDRALDEESLRAGAEFYVADAICHGTDGLIDHHESPNFVEGSLDVLADACQRFELPALLCYGATERNGGREEARRGLAECRRFIESNRRPLVRGAVGLHASFTVSDETLREAGELARELGVAVHLHVAEDEADVRDARRRGYRGVVDRLEELNVLTPGSVLAHGVHLEPEEVQRCAEGGCWFVQNPRSNRANLVGYPSALACTDRVALGTDGYPADLVEEEAVLEEEAFLTLDDMGAALRRLPAGRRLLAELFGGEEALGRHPARRRARSELDGLREAAEAVAPKLWSRLAQY